MGLTEQESRLVRSLSQQGPRMLEEVRRLVAIPTGGNSRAGLDETRGIFRERLERLGANSQLIPGDAKDPWLNVESHDPHVPPTLVCRSARLRGACRVLLSGHLDTVHDPAGPFRVLEVSADGMRAKGPGCVDMKAGLVIACAALEALEASGMAPAWSFILNSDEETGSYHSFTALHTEAGSGYDVGLVFEPALPGGELVIARPGSGQFMIECRGRAAHVGREFARGVSAVSALGECLVRIARMPDLSRGKIANVGPITGGAATNVVPDLARAWGNVRFPSFALGEELRRELESLRTPGEVLPSVSVHTSFNRPSKPTTPGVEALALAARAAAEDLGQRLPFGTTGGVCDGNILQDAGLPVIDTLGARGGGLHTQDEWIEVASLVERAQLVALLMSRLATAGAPSGT